MRTVNKLWGLLLAIPFCAASQQKEAWIKKPTDQWPVIALANHVAYTNGDTYVDPSFKYAGTGFLIDMGNDTLAATAKHILWIARNRNTGGVAVNADLKQWAMTAKDNPKQTVIVKKLLNEDASEVLEGSASSILERDAIFFSVEKASPGIQPLKPRFTPVRPGERVFIISCAYADSTAVVREARVVKQLGLDIVITCDGLDSPGGASGSPIIDTNGQLVGIFSSVSSYEGEDVVVATSTEYLRGVMGKQPDINRPKKDYGELLLRTTLDRSAADAIQLYKALVREPKNFYIFNLRSANRNGLREAGEKLMDMGRYDDAIALLKLNVKENPGYYHNYNVLAKAYLKAGDKKEAIRLLKQSADLYMERDNEAFTELEKLGVAYC
jgi:tetratricopeptide (TPR) repeat protein